MREIHRLSPKNPLDRLALSLRILEMQRDLGRKGGSSAFSILDCPAAGVACEWTAEEIEKSVYRTMRVGSLFGFLNKCMSRSVIRCRLMREAGIDARVIFGLNKNGEALEGHCWVVWECGPAPGVRNSNFKMIEIHPSPDKYPGWAPE
jgi:hypothetical protein